MAQASGATGLNVLASPMLFANGQLIIDRVSALHLPAIYQWAEMAEANGFAAYGPRITQIPEITIRQAAMLFRGARIADIPVDCIAIASAYFSTHVMVLWLSGFW